MTATKPITIREMIDRTADYFAQKGITSARLDAQLLIAHALGKSRLDLYLHFDYPVNETELARARELVRRRAGREPVAYILGKKEFAGRDYKVGPGVLIPRPDTEVLVEEVQRELDARLKPNADDAEGAPVRLLEFGIGSGAIAITLAANNAAVSIVATEVNDAAIAAAQANAEVHGVADRVQVLKQADFTGIEGPFTGIVSNPPYIDEPERAGLEPEVRDHEPNEALFAADGGLRWYKFLADQTTHLLEPGGFLAVEIGYRQRTAVEQIFAAAGLKVDRSVKDFGGNDRVIIARK